MAGNTQNGSRSEGIGDAAPLRDQLHKSRLLSCEAAQLGDVIFDCGFGSEGGLLRSKRRVRLLQDVPQIACRFRAALPTHSRV